MASSQTTFGGVEQPATGENLNVWGPLVNRMLQRSIEMGAGFKTISLTGDYTPTTTVYDANESRWGCIEFTDGGLSSQPTVTLPAETRYWLVINSGSTYAVACKASGSAVAAVTVEASSWAWIYCDGTDMFVRDLSSMSGSLPLASVDGGEDITTVAGIAADVTAVAAIDTDVTAVAADASDIGIVSTNMADVTTCADNISDIQDAASLFGNVVEGPVSSTDNNIPQWDGTGGDTLKAGLAVGTSANNLVQLDGSSRLPAVDGSQLTNLDTGGLTQISTTTISSPVASVEFTSIPSDYDHLYIVFEDVSHNAGGSIAINFQISNDNGSTYSTTTAITNAFASSGNVVGGLVLFGYNSDAGGALVGVEFPIGDPYFQMTNDTTSHWKATGGIDALKVLPQSSSLDAGTITLYGY
jgi:hypothetical protein